jgi:hypothetical protein
MIHKIAFQIGLPISILFFLFSTLAAWYEGSEIVNNPFEWKYSTPFTQLLYEEISDYKDISQLDYFVYAAKFSPAFTIMLISALYIFAVITYLFLKKINFNQLFPAIILFSGIALIFVSYLLLDSTTDGANTIVWVLLVSGVIYIFVGVLYNSKKFRRLKN